jgi:hypothetical protein
VVFAGARIEALVRCEGVALSTRTPAATLYGVAQVRRSLVSAGLRVLHVIFAPASPRALLLGLVRIENRGAEPLVLEYTETWDVAAGEYRAAPTACERRSGGHVFALADASFASRAHPMEPAPARGLALELELAVPARARRHLGFAYAALPEDEDPGGLVRAWRGELARELDRIGASGLSVEAYRDLGRYIRQP